jgi:3-oxoacyl-[acyl-carrier protein] reductase
MDKPVTLITGSRKGIGEQLVRFYAGTGACVVGCSRTPPEWSLDNYTHYTVDVSDERSVVEMFSSIRSEFGRIDHLVNNAGIASMNHSLLTPASTVRKILDTNVVGTFLCSREAAKLMKKNGYGRIVNLSSIAVAMDLEGEAVYVASKAAVESLTRVLAREFAPFGVTVNTLGPTPLETDLIRSVPKEKIERIVQRQIVKEMATPDDIINAIDFFLRPESRLISGQALYLGGA